MADPRAAVDLDAETSRATTNLQTLAEVMLRARPMFHRSLVDWYRDATDSHGLTQLEELFRQLNAGLGSGVLADLFGLAEIFAAALRDGRLDCDAGIRSLMGQLDRVLKPLAQQPPLWPETEARALIERLLDLLGGLEPEDRRLVDLVAVYRASAPIRAAQSPPRERPAQSSEDDTDRTDGRLVELVALEELLERIDRGDFLGPAALDAAYAALHEVVGVLDPSDSCRLAPRLAAIADQVKSLVSAEATEQSMRLEALAADLLALESILQACVDEGVASEASSLGSGMEPAELTLAALRELDGELLGVSELLFGRGIEDLSTRSDAVVTMLARIAGVLRLLGLAEAGDLAAACEDRVRRDDRVRDARSVAVVLDPLAEALACLRREIGAGVAAGLAVPSPTGCVEQALIALARAIEQTSAPSSPPEAPSGLSSDVPSLNRAAPPAQERIAPELMELFVEVIDEDMPSDRERLAGWTLDAPDTSPVNGLKRTSSSAEVDSLSALVPLDGSTRSGVAPQIPIEDLLDTFEAAPETPSEWALPDVDDSHDIDSGDLLARSEQALGEELEQAFSALLDPATEPSEDPAADPALIPSAPAIPEANPISASASLLEQIVEIARCRSELDITHAQLVSGLDALDLGLARLRDLVDRLANEPHPGTVPSGEGVDDRGKSVDQREFCGRVGEILDDLESVRRGLIADRQASDKPRARQTKLLGAVLDALVKLNLESPD